MNARIEDFPYVAYVELKLLDAYHRLNGGIHCGGVIIKPRYILTAAHCVYQSPHLRRRLTVRVGSPYRDGGGSVYPVEGYLINWQYSPVTLNHDIALLRLFQPIDFTHSIARPTEITSLQGTPGLCWLVGARSQDMGRSYPRTFRALH